mgnify:CR=1 FL=1
MTACRGPACDASRLTRWREDTSAFVADVAKARLYELAVLVAFNALQTSAYGAAMAQIVFNATQSLPFN